MRALVLIAVTTITFIANAQYGSPFGNHQFGFDMEIGVRTLPNLVPYIDLERFESWIERNHAAEVVITEDVVRDYVLNREAFNALPEALRTELSEGLNLDGSSNIRQERQQILDSSGNPMSSGPRQIILNQPQVIRPEQALEISRPQQNAPQAPTRELIRPADPLANIRAQDAQVSSDWAILNQRWNNLPIEVKRAAIQIQHLSHNRIAEAILRLPIEMKNIRVMNQIVRVKDSAPEWMKRLNFSLDGRINQRSAANFEISLKGIETDRAVMTGLLDNLVNTLRLRGTLANPPSQNYLDVAFHLHVSYESGYGFSQDREQRFENRLKLYKVLMLARLVAGGPQNDLVLYDMAADRQAGRITPVHLQNMYDTPMRMDRRRMNALQRGEGGTIDKGLIRLISQYYAEIREMTLSPTETLNEFVRLFEIQNEREFLEVLSREISEITRRNPEVLNRIARQNPKILADFQRILPDVQIIDALTHAIRNTPADQTQKVAELHSQLQRFLHTPEVIPRLLELARSGHVKIYGEFIATYRRDYPPEMRAILQQTFEREPHLFDEAATRHFRTENVWNNVTEILSIPNAQEKERALKRLLQIMIAQNGAELADVQQRERLHVAVRDFLLTQQPTGNTKFYAQALKVISDPLFGETLNTAIRSRRYFGWDTAALAKESVFNALQYMITAPNNNGNPTASAFVSHWEGMGQSSPNSQFARAYRPLSGFRFLATKMDLNHTTVYSTLRAHMNEGYFNNNDFRSTIEVLRVLGLSGSEARVQSEEILRELRSRNPELFRERVEQRPRNSFMVRSCRDLFSSAR